MKNVVIEYLLEHCLIKRIDDLFLSSNPTKKKFKPEIGYLKLLPVSQFAAETASFEAKLRQRVDISFDDYVNGILHGGKKSNSLSTVNNVFNEANNKWLLNRLWYDKLTNGQLSVYLRDNVHCPNANISLKTILAATVSADNGMLLLISVYSLIVFFSV